MLPKLWLLWPVALLPLVLISSARSEPDLLVCDEVAHDVAVRDLPSSGRAPLVDAGTSSALTMAEYSRRIAEGLKAQNYLAREDSSALRNHLIAALREHGPEYLDARDNLLGVVKKSGLVPSNMAEGVADRVQASIAEAKNALAAGAVTPQKKGRRLDENPKPKPKPKPEPPPPYVHRPDSDGLFPLIPTYRKIDPVTGEPRGELREERRHGIWSDESGYRQHPEIHRVNENLIGPDGAILLPNGVYNFVLDADGEVRIARQWSRYPHPSLLGGKDPRVKLAGEIHIRDGKVFLINNKSGHFSPSKEALDQHGPAVVQKLEAAVKLRTSRAPEVTLPEFKIDYDPRSRSIGSRSSSPGPTSSSDGSGDGPSP